MAVWQNIGAFDGGGARGRLTTTVVRNIAYAASRILPTHTFGQLFGFLVGTSTGAIIAASLNSRNGVPFLSPAELDDFYQKELPALMKKRFFINAAFTPRFSDDHFNGLLYEVFGDATFDELDRPMVLCSYDMVLPKILYFGTSVRDVYVRDAIRASAAAPTLYKPWKFKTFGGRELHCMDGGININNCPIRTAWNSASREYPQLTKDNMHLVSFGTGTNDDHGTYKHKLGWGYLGLGINTPEMMMRSSVEKAEDDAKRDFRLGETYERINPDLFLASRKPADVSDEQLTALEQAGLKWIHENPETVNRIVEKLTQI